MSPLQQEKCGDFVEIILHIRRSLGFILSVASASIKLEVVGGTPCTHVPGTTAAAAAVEGPNFYELEPQAAKGEMAIFVDVQQQPSRILHKIRRNKKSPSFWDHKNLILFDSNRLQSQGEGGEGKSSSP